MRLLSITGDVLQLNSELPPKTPYAILSHTWGRDEDEVIFEDIASGAVVHNKAGYQKLDFCLEQAARDGYTYVWIDTCCIDKRDRNELGEAINLMYDYYAKATVCYVYLEDVSSHKWREQLSKSRWFTRGWTLQELLAPQDVRFYSADRHLLGDKTSLSAFIEEATMIDISKPLTDISYRERYRWSLGRSTKKAEDRTYCVLGLLQVCLPHNYGEGGSSARERLFAEVSLEHGRRIGNEVREAFVAYTLQAARDEDKTMPKPSRQSTKDKMTPERLLEGLAYPAMNSREATISRPLPNTCTWLLEHADYQKWLRMSGEPLLWLKGKPGVGKSTLMKYASSSATGFRIAFYFNARGEQLERSTTGMYRSLLYQAMRQATYAHDLVLARIEREDSWTWSLRNLQEIMLLVFGVLEAPVRCYIDALDECSTEEVQEMVHYFRDLTLSGSRIYVCFASRYYPTITIAHSVQLLIEDQHHVDIERYVTARLDAHGREGELLKLKVVTKANGVFLWAELVVGLLNRKLSSGSMYNMHETLNSLPEQLIELLQDIALRPAEDDDRFRCCLHWILFSIRPLACDEFYYAVATTMSDSTKVLSYVSSEHMKRFVSSCSRGLAELTRDRPPKVQFIHESVRDFLLENDGLRKLHPEVMVSLQSWIHDRLKETCMKAMPRAFSIDQQSAVTDHPLLSYAAMSVLFHAEQAADAISQKDFLCSWKLTEWQREVSAQEDAHVAVHGVRDATRDISWWRYIPGSQSPMRMLIYYNTPNLIRAAHALQWLDDFHDDKMDSLFLGAIFNGHCEAARALLECGADLNARDVHGYTALTLAISFGDVHCFKMLMQRSPSPGLLAEALWEAVLQWDTAALKGLLECGADANAVLEHPCMAPLLQSARSAFGLRPECVELLFSYNADPQAADVDGWTALHHASYEGNLEAVRLLLDHESSVRARDKDRRTALILASSRECQDIVELLLSYNADPEAADADGCTALHHASRAGKVGCVRLLLDHGSSVRARNNRGETALLRTGYFGNPYIAELLLSRGAQADAADNHGFTALHRACKGDDISLVRVLLDHGCDTMAQTLRGTTALMIASRQAPPDIVELLLIRGAQADALDQYGLTALDHCDARRDDAKVEITRILQQHQSLPPMHRLARRLSSTSSASSSSYTSCSSTMHGI
ncbi:hypothetical protein AMS68_007696 [Peltaster fructicola]|uniref:Uncharacterized protein n=1 Tax=Peltaster fructicola TaxID=286661 RepID=A0A6H0Y5R9_9PEZI|nr:hypothetical protein AMS68_007696 [Peltaster fructicola]